MIPQAISYKDKSGFVVLENQSVYRYVLPVYARQYHHLMRTGLYADLVAKDLLIPHTTRELAEHEKPVYFQVLVPAFIPMVSFPYEWTPGQWKQVVLTALEINLISIRHGMILKDATPFNFTFHQGKCLLIDTLSFDFYHNGPWIAYRQFCESMFGPLSLIYYNSAEWAKLMMASVNGWDLSFIHHNLPLRSYFNLNVLLHIHWHSSYSNKGRGRDLQSKQASLSEQKLTALWSMFYKTVKGWNISRMAKHWSDYYETDIESSEYLDHKTVIITQLFSEIPCDTVIDLGANNGKFSLIAAAYSKNVIAIESDYACVEQCRATIERKGITNITTIVADITQPAPGVGWNNAERMSLLQRLRGNVVLALALIHHLCISKNIPMEFAAGLFHAVTEKYLVIEFVPRSDPKVKQMLANREDVFDDYNEADFVRKFSELFYLERTYTINSSSRKLFVWIRK